MLNIIIFASGSGTNAENIIKYFSNSDLARVSYVLTNNSEAGVIERAKNLKVPVRTFSKAEMKSQQFLEFLTENADFIVLAGFLLMVPKSIISEFNNKIINIHPALLPKYGGRGMYGMHVHNAVVENREIESGITIHYVNEHYDEGAIIFQKTVKVDDTDTPEDVAAKIHLLEHENFPIVIENLLKEFNAG
ncbi:phosphoribosylglycinamide formyltransferase [Lutimonas saemankumensis]|uniref:phosphoribosylglycinamide formyltransferase n=1 Tax=Lutimonas saemankumensis TaxID=483016 RepID=UPI001CD7694B|nr:phosphoribosylglycinamide formyltransferase [Lutimonas saemankumensis]MCA0933179.1 phosphoribosylglycinamide formyltransferase [Lutimonas saemankumensis]